MPAQTVIKIRRDTSTNWSSVDPTLGAGEIAFETDTNKIKVGDGSTAWSSLDYASGAGTAAEITYDNSDAELVASNVKAALDELSLGKADISQLSTNLAVYATTATSDISGYSVLVSSMDDADYDDTAVNVATGAINADDQLIASLAAPAGLFEGHVDAITVTTIGNIRKTAGNNNQSASFYFEVYVRNAAGTETLVGTSGDTGEVNPPDLNVYQRFSASALVQFGDVIDTDRVVIKYYGNVADGSGATYDFQFGGTEPVRTLIPVPANVVVVHEAGGVIVDTSNFDGILSDSDDTVQAALETIDDFVVPPGTTASDSAPSSPEVGQMWWDTTDGTLYIYYDSFWVEAAAAGPTGPQGETGPAGSETLSGLTDTTITGTPADNEFLAYDSASGEWINQTAAEAGVASLSSPSFQNPTFTNYTETLHTVSGTSLTVDLSDGTLQKLTTTGNATITLPSSVAGKSFTIIVVYGGAHSITWAGGSTLKWSEGVAPTLSSSIDIFSFVQDGTNTYGGAAGLAYL